MKKPIIGITTRKVLNDGRDVEKVNSSIINKVIKHGGIPILIPNIKEEAINIIEQCDAFIIPGGITFNKTDEYIINYSINNDIPLLGICAGMQAIANINHFNDIKSDQTIKIENNNHYIDEDKYVHSININDGLLKDILKKDKIMVNSRHNYQVVKENFFIIDAYSDDSVIEAIHIPNKKFILGIEWHPEDLNDEYSDKLFSYFINIIKK